MISDDDDTSYNPDFRLDNWTGLVGRVVSRFECPMDLQYIRVASPCKIFWRTPVPSAFHF